MRALQLQRLEGPSGLCLTELPDLPADAGPVIDVSVAGVGFPELLFSRGEYQMKPPLPFVPGIEVAGRVRHVPAGSLFRPGQRVAAVTMLGGFAEQAVAIPDLTYALPDAIGDYVAVALLVNYHTAHFALADRAQLQPGETLLVSGATGGAGFAAVQVGKRLGARVLGLVGDEAKVEAAREIGCDDVLVAGAELPARVRAATGGRGADVVFDTVGGELFDELVRALASRGRLLVIGFTSGRIPQLGVNRVLLRNISVVGVNWGGLAMADPASFRGPGETLLAWAAEGALRPVVGARYPLAEGARALEDIAARRARGKLVLEVRSASGA